MIIPGPNRIVNEKNVLIRIKIIYKNDDQQEDSISQTPAKQKSLLKPQISTQRVLLQNVLLPRFI